MLIFWRLLLGHFIADFTLQTNKVAQWKRISRWGMVVHVLCHPISYVVLTWKYLSWPWIHVGGVALNGWTCVALISLLHWIEDEWRVWSIRRGTRDSTLFLLWDQIVHWAVLIAFAPVIPGAPAEKWVLAGIGFVILAHFTSVLVFFIENDLGGNSTVLEARKYTFMIERVIGAALFLLPSYFFVLAFAWIGWIVVLHYKREPDRTQAHLLIGNMAVLVVGLCLRRLLLA